MFSILNLILLKATIPAKIILNLTNRSSQAIFLISSKLPWWDLVNSRVWIIITKVLMTCPVPFTSKWHHNNNKMHLTLPMIFKPTNIRIIRFKIILATRASRSNQIMTFKSIPTLKLTMSSPKIMHFSWDTKTNHRRMDYHYLVESNKVLRLDSNSKCKIISSVRNSFIRIQLLNHNYNNSSIPQSQSLIGTLHRNYH